MTKSDRSTDKYATTFFNIPLEKFIDKKHELVVLGDKIDWHRL
jgi:hypothetical protein